MLSADHNLDGVGGQNALGRVKPDWDEVAGTWGSEATAHAWVGRTEGGTCRCDAGAIA